MKSEEEIHVNVMEGFIILGTVAFSISGALIGIKKEMDFFGVMALCTVTALGGGIIRDLLIGQIPPVNLTHPHYFFISIATGVLTWFLYEKIERYNLIIMVTDAIGLGVFTAAGSKAAISHEQEGLLIVLMMGLITGIGGGVIRDVFAKEIPYVFRKEVYAVASIFGSLAMMLVYPMTSVMVSMYVCLVVTFLVRVLSVKYNVHIPVLKKK